MFRRGAAEWILVEADGAARLPVKAPAAHEPVIPSLTTTAVAVVGLRCIGSPLSEENAFRLEEICAITGLKRGDVITPAAVAALACHPLGMFKNVPAAARRFLFGNQADLPGAVSAGAALADALSALCPGFVDGYYVGSLQFKGLACLSYPTLR